MTSNNKPKTGKNDTDNSQVILLDNSDVDSNYATNAHTDQIVHAPPSHAPEPGSILLLGSPLVGLAVFGRKLRKR